MQDFLPPTTGQAHQQQLLERIDQLERLLHERRQGLGTLKAALQGRLAPLGLDTDEKVLDAYRQLDASHRQALHSQLQPASPAAQAQRMTAYRRVGRMV